MAKVALRDYQLDAVQKAREAIRAGAKNILIVAPTGSGKTVIGSHLIDESVAKGKRSAFVIDRLSLLGQTSETFDRYGIDHGIIQGGHWRFKPSLPVQICSIQTVAKRQWPEAQLIIVDEAHTITDTVKKRIMPRDTITIGLTATPFTKGLGVLYDAVVNVTTTNRLIEQGFLANYRIFSCVEPDMEGVKVVAGEFDEVETSKRSLQVVGDVVKEYLDKGEDRKFICSAVDTAHVYELQRQFLAAGINCAAYTYKEREEDRDDILKEYRKADSSIRGLITVTAASKGFDCPDIGCVIMARPLRKSLAEHIQFFGRGLRIADGKENCVARGTLVLTDCGEVPIEQLTLTHKVWDGCDFVSHGGAVCKGIQTVMTYDGVTATPDHEVLTNDGWKRIAQAHHEQRRIVVGGVDGSPVRVADHQFEGSIWKQFQSACASLVLKMQPNAHGTSQQYSKTPRHESLPTLQWSIPGCGPALALPALSIAVQSLHQSARARVQKLWWSWNSVSLLGGERSLCLDSGEPWTSRESVIPNRSDRQQRPLRAGEFALGASGSEYVEHSQVKGWSRHIPGFSSITSRGDVCGFNAATPYLYGDDESGNHQSVERTIVQTEGEVWDVLNAGPLQRFTANGKIVHNCLVLDHSGNSARFWNEWNDFFENGVTELDDGKKKEKPKAKDKDEEKEMVKCPKCRAMHMPRPACPICGFEYPRKKAIEHVPGNLKELVATGNPTLMKKMLWPQVCGYVAQMGYSDNTYNNRRATAIYCEITGGEPPVNSWYENTKPEKPSPELQMKIKANQIRYIKGMQAAARRNEAMAA